MKILLTGATGFVGRHTAMDLISRGYEVYGLVRSSSPRKKLLPEKLHIVDADSDRLPDADVCIHLAWAGAARGGRMDSRLQYENVAAALDMVRKAADAGCGRFIFSGSQAEYGIIAEDMPEGGTGTAAPVTEQASCHPRSEYGKAKLEVLRQASKLCKSLDMTYIHMRLFSIYGPDDQPGSLLSLCAEAFARGETMKAASDCMQMWNFLHVDDCAAAISLLAGCPYPADSDAGETECVVNVAGEKSRILRSYIEDMARLAGGRVVFGERLASPEGTPYLNPDISRLTGLTGFRERITWEQGAAQVMRYHREQSNTARGF